MTQIRFAISGSRELLRRDFGPEVWEGEPRLPSVLVSYHYRRDWEVGQDVVARRSWVLDSGAFSALNAGVAIDLGEFADYALAALESDDPPEEVFCLDVIGDWRKGWENWLELDRRGVRTIPCYHSGEPVELLRDMAAASGKVALGGVALVRMSKGKTDWFRRCFDAAWPCLFHAFGMTTERLLRRLPFDSADSTNWKTLSQMFGLWKAFGRGLAGRVGTGPSRAAEIAAHLAMETELEAQWRAVLEPLRSAAVHSRHGGQRPSGG